MEWPNPDWDNSQFLGSSDSVPAVPFTGTILMTVVNGQERASVQRRVATIKETICRLALEEISEGVRADRLRTLLRELKVLEGALQATIDPRVESMYLELADLGDRWDMSETQRLTAQAQLLWSVVAIKRRETSLLASGRLVKALLSQATAVAPKKHHAMPQRFGLD
jgi:hypothetical protein